MVGDGRRCLGNLGRIAGIDHHQPWNHAHQGEILDRLMRAAIAGRKARQAGDDLDVELAVRTGDGDEIVGTPGGEDAVGGGERHVAGARQAGRDCDEVLLRHADVEEALGKGVAKGQDVGVFAEIGGEADDIGPMVRDLDKGLAERRVDRRPAGTGRLVLAHRQGACGFNHGRPPRACRVLSAERPIRRARPARNAPSRAVRASARR